MNNAIGYVLVSKTCRSVMHACDAQGCGRDYRYCATPKRPGCQSVCVHHPARLEEHPECQQWQRDYAAWVAAHFTDEPTGGTRLGPLHYFSDCRTLLKRGPRRADARIVPMDSVTAEALGLPTCKECQRKMAPLEAQMDGDWARQQHA